MFIHDINPDLISIGPLTIRVYGLVYVIGFLVTLFIFLKIADKKKIKNLTKDRAADLILYMMLFGVLGARLMHVLLFIKNYIANPLDIIKFWQGGMAFIGGFIAAVLFIIFYCKKHEISFYQVADIIVIPFALFLGFGRIANFINSEFIGTVTNVPWCVQFKNYLGCRHPSQIYESLKNFFIFGVLFLLNKKKHKQGLIFWSFITLYGLLRFIVNFWRQDVLYFGLSLGQYLGLGMFILGLIILIKQKYIKIKN
jgi:phosphatidylglycerol---prolipoprotein diacylglyceryl transferase